MNLHEVKHLDFKASVNLGSFYTPPGLVDIAYNLVQKNVANFSDYKILDTSCGYGGFLRGENAIGADIDGEALSFAQKQNEKTKFLEQNGLKNVSRERYGLNENSKFVIIGNPPYNDRTSQIRNTIKCDKTEIDDDLKTRDLGL